MVSGCRRVKLKWVTLDALLCQQLREVALPFGRSEKCDWAARSRVIETLSLIIDEKEQFVLHDGTAKRSAKHVPAEGGLCETLKIVGPVVGVQGVVSKELEDVAMIAVGARLDRHFEPPWKLPTRRVLGNQAKFLNRVTLG